ncbi:MAG: fumarylacetoacetate hydrolase family protein [Chloroflexi bacterium]|nr:fumarylacetoacetate hydrolase family protein [Chloroflexota bacterium]
MKFVLFERSGTTPAYGILRGEAILPLEGTLTGDTPQEQLRQLINSADTARPRQDAAALPLAQVRLLPPVPAPGKIVVTTATYGASAPAQQLLATLKSAESVVGPEDTVRLPAVDSRWQFVPQASLGLVVRGPAKNVSAANWQHAVFGFTCVIDVMARGDQQFGRDYWLSKADTLGPLGPCIVTLDEFSDPTALRVRSWQNGDAAQDYAIADASHSIGEQLEFVTTVMTLHSGDVLACGSAADGQRPLADGDRIEVEIDGIGRLAVNVAAMVGSAV